MRLAKEDKEFQNEIRNARAYNGWSVELFSARFGYFDLLRFLLDEILPE
jgi:hypothetical protein